MSFLTSEDGKRIVEDYPPPATSIAGVTFDASELENNPWKVVPRDVDLSHWLRILPRTRRSATVREHAVLYDDSIRPPPSPNAPWTMTVSLYGFIDNMNLAPTGNWDLTELNAPKAQQWVRLRPGSRPEQFKAQGDAISAIEQHIIGTLRGGGLEVHAQDAMLAGRRRTLYISRRVFEKVTKTSPPSLPTTGPATKLINKWRITSAPRLGVRQDDLQIQACNAARFSPGDFVQATVKFVVLTKEARQNEPVDVVVHMNLVTLIRLVPARNVDAIMPGAHAPLISPEEDEEGIIVVENVDSGPVMI